jgi:hypothetical protein
MVKINVMHKDPSEIMELVRKIRSEGLVQGQDFDFAFHQSKWDEMIGEIPKHTVFTFYIEKHATLFALKYGS